MTSLDISNFEIKSVAYYAILISMFEGCKNLKYLNFFKLYDDMNNYYTRIFENTPENMVICLSEFFNPTLKTIFNNKTCGVITCDKNWETKQKK